MSATYNGLEICYYAFKEQVKRESDLVVLFVHWYLVKNGFTCVVNGRVSIQIVKYCYSLYGKI